MKENKDNFIPFIGGVANGQWKKNSSSIDRYVARRTQLAPSFHEDGGNGPVGIVPDEDRYRRERIRGESKEWFIYVLDSLTLDQAMEMLINGYMKK